MSEFLTRQPHPECREARCARDGAAPVRPAVELRAAACCAGTRDGAVTLFVAPQEGPGEVLAFRGPEPDSLEAAGTFVRFESPVRSMNTLELAGELRLFVLADRGYLLDRDGRVVQSLTVDGEYACAFTDRDGGLMLAVDGALYRPSGTELVRLGAVKSRPYRMTGLERYDCLWERGSDVPGHIGGSMIWYRGQYLYAVADRFDRCGRANIDTFLCEAPNLDGPMSRRYLLLPNGGAATLFVGTDGELWAAFVGSTPFSAVYGYPALVKLQRQELGFYRPECAALEDSAVDRLVPAENGGMEIRDTFVYRAPDGLYYMTGTTRKEKGTFWRNTNGVFLWRSENLRVWEPLGTVYAYSENDGSWQSNTGSNCWAPEMIFRDGHFYITYSVAPGCGLIKSVGSDPRGPYLDMGRYVVRGIDSGFFLDDDGTLYLVWQNGRLAPFTPDMRSFSRESQLLLDGDGRQVGYEGAGIIKVQGKYVLYAAEWNGDTRIDGTYDMMYAVSDDLMGPYGPRRTLIPHGGHGCLFYDREGRLRFTMFGNDRTAPFSRRPGIGFVDIRWEQGELILAPGETE